ncbi:nitrilase-related carbon-nitrogen hydrolase [Pseudomonas sp. HY2-MNA-CIBAN-0224]|uniref:nitrilase-related carbon-nitrogen hydrolase n=1 Tax=Pseudomonas sp. HY2-MNA-CIBAN-0224 TaxID=3140471 RepID=UPI00333430AE
MKVEFAQLAGRDNGTAYNLERALASIAACAADTQLIVFPETHLMGFPSAETVAAVAESIDGPTVQAIIQAAQARNIAVVIGMAENDDGKFYNTTLMVNRVEEGDGGLLFAGGSALVDPFGTLLFEAGREEGQFRVELDLAQLKAARKDYRYLDDQRLKLPGEVIERADGTRELLIPA